MANLTRYTDQMAYFSGQLNEGPLSMRIYILKGYVLTDLVPQHSSFSHQPPYSGKMRPEINKLRDDPLQGRCDITTLALIAIKYKACCDRFGCQP